MKTPESEEPEMPENERRSREAYAEHVSSVEECIDEPEETE